MYADFGKIVKLLITFEPALVTGRLLATRDELAVSGKDETESASEYIVVERYFQKHYLEQLLPGGGGGAGGTTPATKPPYEQFYTFEGVLNFIRGAL